MKMFFWSKLLPLISSLFATARQNSTDLLLILVLLLGITDRFGVVWYRIPMCPFSVEITREGYMLLLLLQSMCVLSSCPHKTLKVLFMTCKCKNRQSPLTTESKQLCPNKLPRKHIWVLRILQRLWDIYKWTKQIVALRLVMTTFSEELFSVYSCSWNPLPPPPVMSDEKF